VPTQQETFNTIVKHLRKQGKKANIDGCCKYRLETPEGVLMCAAGCLIPDEKYEPSFEGKLVTTCPKLKEILSDLGHDTYIIRSLQGIHDEHEVEDWEKEFSAVASNYKLTVPENDMLDRVNK
jgi:hypothetical protein